MGKALILIAALSLSGCTTTPKPVENPRQIWCDTNKPRRDYTPETPRNVVDEINAHNKKGARWCRWAP